MSASPQQYCLRWNNYQNNLTNVFDQLLQSEAFVDVTLACDGESLKAHKMILSACSPYFQQLFFDNPCSHPIVILKDVKWDELKLCIEFMYRGEINVSQEQLAPLLKVAELLKIRGLADVSRGSPGDPSSNSTGKLSTPVSSASLGSDTMVSNSHPNPAVLVQQLARPVDLGGESPISRKTQSMLHRSHSAAPFHIPNQTLSLHPFNLQHQLAAASVSNAHQFLNTLRRKRRKVSNFSDDLSLSPSDAFDEERNEVDSPNGGYETPSPMALLEAGLLGSTSSSSTPALLPSVAAGLSSSASAGLERGGGSLPSSALPTSSSSLTPASLLSFHSAMAAAAAATNNPTPSSSTIASASAMNDMDLKPGIREMIREEERAKMLESSHGWLGPSGGTVGTPTTSALSESYQYQIQSLWQKCWNTNQSGMAQALRFRERGPLKSWRPETMADAIFAVLREGLSLSQAARKFDIPYPTFVLYANRVHNMLGPSSDGSGDLMSDMRPKGRGRPQRILLGTWPEDHIHGVIRAVVFRDGAKDDLPFSFGRDFLQPHPVTSHNSTNGLDMSLHAPFFGLHPHRNGPSSNHSFGSTSERCSSSLSGLKSHLNTSSRSNSPLLDGLGDSSSLPEDILREQREEEILRAMKKSGDDDENVEDEEEDEEEVILRRKRALNSLLLSERRLNSKRALNLHRERLNNLEKGHNQQQANSNSNSNGDAGPEIVHIKTEVEYNEDDLMDDCDAQEEDGLFIHEEKSNGLDSIEKESQNCPKHTTLPTIAEESHHGPGSELLEKALLSTTVNSSDRALAQSDVTCSPMSEAINTSANETSSGVVNISSRILTLETGLLTSTASEKGESLLESSANDSTLLASQE